MTGDPCGICGGDRKESTTTFTVDYGTGIVVVRNVPAHVCGQCGEEWIPDDVAARLERIAQGARDQKRQVEVIDFAVAVAA